MADYQKMYAILCGAASNAINALPDTPETAASRQLLLEALALAEELVSCRQGVKDQWAAGDMYHVTLGRTACPYKKFAPLLPRFLSKTAPNLSLEAVFISFHPVSNHLPRTGDGSR